MRWSAQTTTEEAERRLPGYRDAAVVRTFDAPEALHTRFYEVHAKSALNKVPARMPWGWTINPYRGCTHACAYCFARPTHEFLDLNAREDFEREIVVKVNVPEVLRAELARPSWKGEHVAMGTNTDPYQWVEGRYRLMEGIWEALRDAANPASILTKSPLLLRDTKLLQELGERAEVSAAFSVPTIDEKAWRAAEPHTPHPRKRLEAVAELTRAGIPTGVLVAPLIPGVNDDPAHVEEIVELATAAGASHIGGIALHLRGEVRDIWFDWLGAHRPDLVPHYQRLYRRGAYMQAPERERLGEMVAVARERARRKHPDPPRPAPPRFRRGLDADTDEPPPQRAPARKPQQGALF